MGTYIVNDVPLNDPDGRWFQEFASHTPAPSGVEVASVSSPGVHGARLSGKRARKPGQVVLSIAVVGKNEPQLRERFLELANVLASWETHGLLTVEYDDGETVKRNMGVVSSELTPKEFGLGVMVLPVTIFLPDPFWEETEEYTLRPQPNQAAQWGLLSGGSAPVFPTVHVRGNGSDVTGVRVECLVSGNVAVWSGRARELTWKQWNVSAGDGGEPDRSLSFGVEAEPVLYPDAEGDYRLRVEVSGGGRAFVELKGARRFQC